MTIYPDEQKARLIERMLPPGQANVPRLAKETGIPRDTLYGWRRQALRARGLSTTPAAGGGERWSSTEKFAMVVETAALSEVERGEYGVCSRNGKKSYAMGRTCQVEVFDVVTDTSDKAKIDPNLTLFRTLPDISLGYASS